MTQRRRTTSSNRPSADASPERAPSEPVLPNASSAENGPSEPDPIVRPAALASSQIVRGIAPIPRRRRAMRGDTQMGVQVFLRKQKIKPDHGAPFAETQKGQRRTFTEWQTEWAAYQARPMR